MFKLEEDIVSYETALAAMAVGFPQHEYFFKERVKMSVYCAHDKTGEIELNAGEWATIVCTAPTQALLQKWLRDEMGIQLDTFWDIYDGLVWCVGVSLIGQFFEHEENPRSPCVLIDHDSDSHPEALEIGLLESIKLIG